LPEAQLDRFMFKLLVPYPARESLRQMLDVSLDAEPSDTLEPIASAADVLRIMRLARTVLLGDRCKEAAIELVMATQPETAGATSDARRHIRYGASPRALQALVRAARVRALMANRSHVDVYDIDAVALPVMRHRVLLRLESELDGLDAESTLASIIDAWRRRL
jgi:MoxR-like ATPase